ncbi:hypothetical protein N7462_006353 [Penicillium macrosclerotiorum]|uniref:uncharacterized protein n=1 Tax=Penicillium macrosclerotiorum TaxID=303699 RepID=UPI002548C5AA|nr:uncharacterized protein N7462_006353 [Penicillium macrosclerotiorum]KAJ5683188.1 hypothetical protein N7462_006353 [Penicillium macrosclerotiorum]
MDELQPYTFMASAGSSHSDSTPKPTPLDRPSFTFIGHDDDLTLKRIKDVNARKAIRSHVMRDVRRRERLAGLKRTSRRENRGEAAPTSSPGKQSESEDQRLVLRAASQSSPSSLIKTETDDKFLYSKHRRDRPSKWSAGYPLVTQLTPSPRSLPTSWFFDPFCSLPGTSELPSMVAHLVYYWKSVFVPMTFPSELKGRESQEVELMVRSSFSDPGSFFGLMSMCAAHRAVLAVDRFGTLNSELHNRIVNDPDYCIMKAKSIREMNAKMRDSQRALSDEAFDTIVNLLTGSLIAGLFDEARIHLTGLRRMVELRGGITDESIRSASMLSAIITTDVKAASGLLVKPVFPLTWDSQPVPQVIQQRIQPPTSSPAYQLGSGFFSNMLLSSPLIRILHVIRDIIYYSLTVQTVPAVIQPDDHHFFRVLNCEAEHQLLSYVYTNSSPTVDHLGLPFEIHPIEAVTRVAAISFLNNFLIVSPPSSGLGRALTNHLRAAMSNCTLCLLFTMSKENFGCFAWALFIGAHGALGQAERPWFMERLARIAIICEWQTWEQVSRILSDYFFIPAIHEIEWRSIWDEAMAGFVSSLEHP